MGVGVVCFQQDESSKIKVLVVEPGGGVVSGGDGAAAGDVVRLQVLVMVWSSLEVGAEEVITC